MTHATLLARVQMMERELHEKQIAEERSRKLAAEARLRSLESWIHPHFLFNTLNSISALIAIDPARADQIVGRLAFCCELPGHRVRALGRQATRAS